MGDVIIIYEKGQTGVMDADLLYVPPFWREPKNDFQQMLKEDKSDTESNQETS